MKKRIGFFGGTFDPPHCGHALLAEYAYEQGNLDALLWVLTPLSPFKETTYATLDQRIAMIEMMLTYQKFSRLSRAEIDRNPPYYTLDTAKLLRSQLGAEDELYFVLGGDAMRYFPKWHGAYELIDRVLDGLIVARRPGDGLDLSRTEKAMPGISNKMTVVTMKRLPIASSEIRTKIQRGLSVEGEVVPEVFSYIQKNHLYEDLSQE
jgi:nicotinate-nucleotide adenylyltransferase